MPFHSLNLAALLLTLACLTFSARIYRKVVLTHPDALCLDGSRGAYYISDGRETGKFLISFDSGALCGNSSGLNSTLDDCLQRAKTILGSSSDYPDTMTFSQGIFSDIPENHFKDWTIARFKYCDGSIHQGYRKDPVIHKGTPLYFRGHNITEAQLYSIDHSHYLFRNATEIVVAGQSAGAVAVYLWANYIAGRAPMNAKVWALPDSGIFLDAMDYNIKKNTLRMSFQNLMNFSNAEVDPPVPECVAANPDAKWKCMFAEYLFPYVKVPLFAIQSAYDTWSVPNILGIKCQNNASLQNCDTGSREYMEEYHANISAVLHRIAHRKENGFWMIACSNHIFSTIDRYTSQDFRVPAYSKHSLALSVKEWITAKAKSHVHEDRGNWPTNKPCSGVISQEI